MHWRSLSPWGLLIALIGFVLTRVTVTLAATESTVQFLFAGIVPLVLGLGLAAFGVILTVGAYDRVFVRTTALWCLLGTGTMGVLVVLTVLGAQPDLMDPIELRQQTYLSNFLIGGAVGGTLTGLYAARNRRHRRDLARQANRLILLNRLLRDKVINSATAIKGHASVLQEQHNEDSADVVGEQAQDIVDTVENVKYLSNTADRSDVTLGPVDVVECLRSELAAIEAAHSDTEITNALPDEEIRVRANAQLAEVFGQLLSNAVAYSEGTPRIEATVDPAPNHVTIRISDNGPGLPESQQALLERGEIAEFDDPTTGFGLNIVRLLVESFNGEIRTAVDENGTSVSIRLPRTGEQPGSGSTSTVATAGSGTLTTPGVSPSRILLTVAASLIAGVTMGIAMALTGGDVPVIGALYGIKDPVVAIISHEFHSVVFGLVYAGILSALPTARSRDFAHRVGIALLFGFLLWFLAAGLIMPLWLQFVGIETTIPNLTVPSFVGHLVWGLTLSGIYHYGDGLLTETAPLDQFTGIVSQVRS